MILAISRFRVANGKEQEVAAAFLGRPHLVDSAPGFLGMETFTEAADPSMFYLVTRWSDRASFGTWHRSAAHHDSHAWMPAGLKLDAAYTQVLELDRITGREGADSVERVLDAALPLEQFVRHTRLVHVITAAPDGTIRAVNAAAARTMRREAGELAGKSLFAFVAEHDADRLRRLAAGEPLAGPLRINLCDMDGHLTTLWWVVRASAAELLLIGEPEWEDEREMQHQLLALNAELATLARGRQRSARAEETARRAAEAANRSKDEALAAIAHELKQPLNAATMALTLLQRQSGATGRVHELLARQLTHMSRLVDDLLDASRVLRGDVRFDLRWVDLRDVVREVVDSVSVLTLARGQHVSADLPDEPVAVTGDQARLRQVFSNLLTNAHKYTGPGGQIRITVATTDAAAVVRVRDTGEGIAPETLEHLFDLFVRGTHSAAGLGIGLALARRLVEGHGGTITAKSEGRGHGAEFTVRLPLHAGH